MYLTSSLTAARYWLVDISPDGKIHWLNADIIWSTSGGGPAQQTGKLPIVTYPQEHSKTQNTHSMKLQTPHCVVIVNCLYIAILVSVPLLWYLHPRVKIYINSKHTFERWRPSSFHVKYEKCMQLCYEVNNCSCRSIQLTGCVLCWGSNISRSRKHQTFLSSKFSPAAAAAATGPPAS